MKMRYTFSSSICLRTNINTSIKYALRKFHPHIVMDIKTPYKLQRGCEARNLCVEHEWKKKSTTFINSSVSALTWNLICSIKMSIECTLNAVVIGIQSCPI